MPSTSIIKITGLHTNDSELSEVPEGSLADCNNIVIDKKSIAENRRGFKLYGNAMGVSPSTDLAKQLLVYKNRILRHYSSTIEFDNGSGTFAAFSGSYSELATGIRLRGLESKGNFYFTTSTGVKKISAKSANDLTTAAGFITEAGGVKALDLTLDLNPQQGFLPQNSKVAYRIVWGIKDANNNLILGAPSSRTIIENSMALQMVKDFNNLLSVLDTEAAIDSGDELSDTDYVATLKIPATSAASATALRTNLILLATKLEEDLNTISAPLYSITTTSAELTSNIATINFSGNIPAWVVPGISIRIQGFTGLLEPLNGDRVVTSTTATSLNFALTNANIANTISTDGTVRQIEFLDLVQPAEPSANPTTSELEDIQAYYDQMVEILQAEPTTKIFNNTGGISPFDDSFSIQSATVDVTFTIPNGINTAYFYQIYRTAIAQATGPVTLEDVDPGDEMGLVYEANPTSLEILAQSITVQDITPDAFRGANLYTNPQSGEGILQANERPPLARDLASFKSHIFYANTSTEHKLLVSLLGATNITAGVSQLRIGYGDDVEIYNFANPISEETDVETVADVAGSLAGTYFLLNNANNKIEYYVWFKSSGVGVDPAIVDKTGVLVEVDNNDADTVVASKLKAELEKLNDFVVEVTGNTVTVANVAQGPTTDAVDFDTGFTITVAIQGAGEDASTNTVLRSDAPTPAQQVDETARSLVRIINKNSTGKIYADYLSGPNDVPGQMVFRNRNLTDPQFFLYVDNKNTTGISFSPNLPEMQSITAIAATDPVEVTSVGHGLITGDLVYIRGTDSVASLVGQYEVTVIDADTFTVEAEVITPGTTGQFMLDSLMIESDNESFGNRIYFSKFSEPEAVPLVNYFDVGPRDKAILRILPIRDGLFILKEDGVYRISGEGGNVGFVLGLFDNTIKIAAHDSAVVLNNQIFFFSDQGVATISDTGIQIVSENMENLMSEIAEHTNFESSTFGVAYEADRAYLVFTTSSNSDTHATQCFRFNFSTQTWTRWKVSKTCGIVNSSKVYLGVPDTNFIEQERKTFDRKDYCDREFEKILNPDAVSGMEVKLPSLANVKVGDSLTQEQYLTIYQFNQLLTKLDLDNGVNDQDYYNTFNVSAGVNLRNQLTDLAIKLDADAGIVSSAFVSSISGFGTSFSETQEAFNTIVNILNTDAGVQFSNYKLSQGTVLQESQIESINNVFGTVTLQYNLPLVEGLIKTYQHIPVSITWNVQPLGDPEVYKQVSEGKFIFQQTNFTKAIASFASDISPSFESTEFFKQGNGLFGYVEGDADTFGGGGDKTPFRTYIPRNKQRCRYIIPKIEHRIAREQFRVLGYNLTFTPYSLKAYRG